jgi:NAD(P)H dehydrogenase (quinone)
MIVVTGASGKLGHLTVDALLGMRRFPASEIVAVARTVSKAGDLAALGVQVRRADYEEPDSLSSAFAGADVLVLISSNEVGKRFAQHRNAIDAAKRAGVARIVYTSLLHADVSPLSLAGEHLETERAIRESGVPYTILRNGWYTENYVGAIPKALASGAFIGAAGEGRISSAARADFGLAAAVAAVDASAGNRVYELAGDDSYTLADLAAEVSRQTGRSIPYRDLPEAEYSAFLTKAGMPKAIADMVASWDAGAARGALYDNSRALSRLIGRPTTALGAVVAAAIGE